MNMNIIEGNQSKQESRNYIKFIANGFFKLVTNFFFSVFSLLSYLRVSAMWLSVTVEFLIYRS